MDYFTSSSTCSHRRRGSSTRSNGCGAMLSESTSATSHRRPATPRPEASLPRRLADSLIAILLAPGCAACARPLERPTLGPVCAACWRAVVSIAPPFCAQCGDPLATWRVTRGCRPAVRAAAASRQQSRWPAPSDRTTARYARSCTRSSTARVRSLAAPLAQLMTRHGRSALLDGVEVVVPVPLHWRRRRRARASIRRRSWRGGSACRAQRAAADAGARRRRPICRPHSGRRNVRVRSRCGGGADGQPGEWCCWWTMCRRPARRWRRARGCCARPARARCGRLRRPES